MGLYLLQGSQLLLPLLLVPPLSEAVVLPSSLLMPRRLWLLVVLQPGPSLMVVGVPAVSPR